MHGLMSYRRFGSARSLRSDRAGQTLGRCVATGLGSSSVATLVRHQAEKEQVRAGAEFPSSSALAIAPGHGTEVVTPRDAGTLTGSGVLGASALPAGSSTTPILVEDKERAADSMSPPPGRKEIPLGRSSLWHHETTQEMPRELPLPNDENGHSVKKNDEHFNTYFAQKLQTTAFSAKSGADHIELSNVLNRHSHLTKMTLIHPTQG
ncbi:hypothetical protein F2Q70_00018344 [Brassica cretica]|uniref:Uncharacterized protein n=1 Tax=Brassica cretica TaxID=69181 RepID=A0A8S9I041_BRACR|nr:hypothetical protein F2Q70_00018344 [Brassica cretica]